MNAKLEIIKKRYPHFDENIQTKDIEVNGEAVMEMMDELIDKIVEMYVPDGSLEGFLDRIQSLKD